MGRGTDLCRDSAPAHAALIDEFKEQLLIVAMKRLAALGDDLVFPLAEVDDTSQDMLAFAIADDNGRKSFRFTLRKKA